MRNKKICVYTCITGGYDNLQPIYREEGVDYICFTDNKQLCSEEWKIIYVEDKELLGEMLLSRKIKIVGHPYLKENYDISIWVDGAVQVKDSLSNLVYEICELDKYAMVCFKHNARDCVYEEAIACIKGLKLKKEDVETYFTYMQKTDFPKHFGLAECTILIRNHNDSKVENTMDIWFELLRNNAKRDQLWFPYSLFKTGLEIKWLDYTVLDNPWFVWKAHRQSKETDYCRVFFGEYKDLEKDQYIDLFLDVDREKQSLAFVIPEDCNELNINMGKHFGRNIPQFKMNMKEYAIEYKTGISLKNCQVMNYDDVIVRIKGKFFKGQEIICEFILDKNFNNANNILENIIDNDYYNARNWFYLQKHLNEELVKVNDELEKYRKVTNTPLFDKLKPLCERQDLLVKLLRKIILKVI